jgi:DnaJ-class molecular chaperone
VYFRIEDAGGQPFVRRGEYDLSTVVMVDEGQLEATVLGVDGEDITVEVLGRTSITLQGKGMPKDPLGRNRGDLIVQVQPCSID